ncbi:MAG: NAD-dependent epimerase/dehydratase family protein [Streptosporangiales bacterium]|nr:NAD-dependent epimerase/dehydratase family protein [Streptosporangiales bacterium]
MRVLVTGGAGFIGSWLVRELAAAGHVVHVLDERPPAAGCPSARVLTGDVRDPDAVADAVAGVDAVCHLAAMVGLATDMADLPRYAGVNVHGTAVLLAEMARAGVPRLALASSMVVYGEGTYACTQHGSVRPAPRTRDDLDSGVFEPRCPYCGSALSPRTVGEDAPLDPRNGYATTKLAQEHLAANWARETGGTAVALRYHNVYGPGLPRDTPYAGVAAIFCSALLRGEAPRVFEDGRQRRDFVHVRDVARATALGLSASTGSGVLPGGLRAYNIASGQPRTIGEVAEAMATACGGPAPVVTGQYRLGDVRHIVATPERAADELGYTAREPFDAGMAELVAEFGGSALSGSAAGVPRTDSLVRRS